MLLYVCTVWDLFAAGSRTARADWSYRSQWELFRIQRGTLEHCGERTSCGLAHLEVTHSAYGFCVVFQGFPVGSEIRTQSIKGQRPIKLGQTPSLWWRGATLGLFLPSSVNDWKQGVSEDRNCSLKHITNRLTQCV